jgi:hypothetical protein
MGSTLILAVVNIFVIVPGRAICHSARFKPDYRLDRTLTRALERFRSLADAQDGRRRLVCQFTVVVPIGTLIAFATAVN